jgi:hypothetical protein
MEACVPAAKTAVEARRSPMSLKGETPIQRVTSDALSSWRARRPKQLGP